MTRSFMSMIAPVAADYSFWPALADRFGEEYAHELEQCIQELSSSGGSDIDVWSLLWKDPDSAFATLHLSCPWARSWLPWWLQQAPAGDVLDLGSGSGVLTCFYAMQRPDSQVVGVDVHPRAAAIGEEVASRLGLNNVAFMSADVAAADIGRKFSCVTSTAVRHEFGWNDAPVFSSVSLLHGPRSAGAALANTAARHLASNGKYLSLERCPDTVSLMEWIGDLHAADLSPDLAESVDVTGSSWGGAERFPAIVAERTPPRPLDELVDFAAARGDELVRTEARIATVDQLDLLGGFHADVADDEGEGVTRFYLLDVEGEPLLWQTTDRGYRKEPLPGRSLAELNRHLASMREAFDGAPEVVGIRDLVSGDIQDLRAGPE